MIGNCPITGNANPVSLKSARPKILVLCPDLPYPIYAGGQMRMASICEALSSCCDVHIACLAPKIPAETLAWAGALKITMDHFQGAVCGQLSSWHRHVQMVMIQNNLRYDRKEKEFFDAVCRKIKPDLVWLETPYLIRYGLDWNDRIPFVVDYWGTSQGARRLFEHSKGFRKTKEWLKWWAASGGERRYAKRLQDIVCVSKLDADYFQTIAPRSRIWPIPNGIIKPEIPTRETHGKPGNPLSMVFTGDLSYVPNIDAAVYFAHHIFPMIQEEVPESTFRIVGRNPARDILALNKLTGVKVVGFVPDLRKEIKQATIYVLPMRLGSGIRSKLFDVFPLAKAIVTTSVGAEGLDLHHDLNCMIADQAHDFAQNCIRLLRNEEKRRKLGDEAKRLAVEVYMQANINRLVQEVVVKILYG